MKPALKFDHEPDPALDDDMWVESLDFHKACKSGAFALHNIAVNWFSASLYLGKYFGKGLLPYNIFMAFCTIDNNVFSKVPDLGKSEEAIPLDPRRPFYLKWILDGPQTVWFRNLKNTIARFENREAGDEFIVVLDDDIDVLFKDRTTGSKDRTTGNYVSVDSEAPTTEEQGLQLGLQHAIGLLKLRFREFTRGKSSEDGKDLTFVAKNELVEYLKRLKWRGVNGMTRLTVISEAKISAADLESIKDENYRVIYFYRRRWAERVVYDFRNESPATAFGTLGKASLATISWALNKGGPAFVCVLTGLHALHKIENLDGYYPSDDYTDRIKLAAWFAGNLWTCWDGKTLSNNVIKGNVAEIFTKRISEKVYHGESLDINPLPFIGTAGISLITNIALGITAALFYTVDGLETTVDDINFIAGSNISLSHEWEIALIAFALASSIIISIATSSAQLYYVLDNGNLQFEHSSKATERHPWTWRTFNVSSWFDSGGYGYNTGVNVYNSCLILRKKSSTVDNYLKQHEPLEGAVIGTIGISCAAMQLFWSIYKALPKFNKCMRFSEKIDAKLPCACGLFGGRNELQHAMLATEETLPPELSTTNNPGSQIGTYDVRY